MFEKLWRTGSAQIVIGTGAGYMLAAVSIPLLSRLYSPEQFGIYTLIFTVASLLAPVLGLKYEMALPIARSPRRAYDLAILAIIIATFATLVMVVTLFSLSERLTDALGEGGAYLWTSPFLAISMMVALAVNQAAIRQKDYRSIAERNFANSAGSAGLQVGLGTFIPPAAPGLIWGAIGGQIIGSVLGTRRLWAILRRQRPSLRRMMRAARQFKRYPGVLAPSAFINGIGGQLPLLLYAAWYGSAFLGSLGMAQRVLAIPVALLGMALAQVFLGRLSELVRTNQRQAIKGEFTKTAKRLIATSAILGSLVYLYSPQAFVAILGAEWAEAGDFARALSVMFLVQFVVQPLSQTLLVAQWHRVQLAADIARLCLLNGGIFIAHQMNVTPVQAVWIYSTIYAATYLLYGLLAYSAVSRAHGWRMPDDNA